MRDPGALPADPGVAVVTVSYFSTDALEGLIESLHASTVAPAATIVVNNAPDDVLELPELPGLEVVEAKGNLGYGAGINLGARRLGPDIHWILVTNPDVRLSRHALESLLEVAQAEPDAGAIGPRIIEPGGEVYPSARELPSLRTGVGHALFANVWLSNPWSRRYHGEYRASSAQWRETGWLSGSCQLVRREAFDAIGGFDDSYFMYFEDVDLGDRLTKAGWRNLYVPAASVMHTGAHSTKTRAAAMRAEHHRSAYLYLSRKYSGWYLAPLRLCLRIALGARAHITSRG
ncbi:glycosyltransferase family 2 protein [Gryllotalpicola daejeonensis]|uniref:Glycosyltransferase family 2 protein n=1 Tax=Gryllotalpicola daejeonensis TaxID=993087 RepID=A0ABP7ZN99_9MICO